MDAQAACVRLLFVRGVKCFPQRKPYNICMRFLLSWHSVCVRVGVDMFAYCEYVMTVFCYCEHLDPIKQTHLG